LDALPGGADVVGSDELLLSRLNAIDDRIGGKRDGFPSGLVELDAVIGGFEPGELIVVGARPSRGKSALGLTFASNASELGVPVLFVSLEMSAGQLGDRLLAMRSGVGMSLFTRGVMRGAQLGGEQLERLTEASRRRPGQAPIYFDDKPGRTAADILSAGRRAVRRRKVGLIVVDYLQMIRSANPKEHREAQVADISRNMKVLARSCGVPVVCLAQLNRESEKDKRRPRMSDLRESGAIEQDTDKGILIHDPEPADGERPVERRVELIVDKQRNGPTGPVEVWYAANVMRFEDLPRGPGY
jgi:replicative DNA helicase